MAKKCLIYAPAVGRGGVRRVIETLCQQFDKQRGWEFAILGQTFDELGDRIDWPEGWTFTQIRPVDKLPLHPKQFDFLMRNRGEFFAHLQEVAGEYDVVFCPTPWWGFIGVDPVETPVVSFVPDFAFDMIDMSQMLQAYFRGISPIIANHSAHTIFPSKFQQAYGDEHFGFAGKSSVIYFSTDVASPMVDARVDRAADEAAADRAGPVPTGDNVLSGDNISSVRLKYGLPEGYVLAFHCYGHKAAEVIIRAQYFARKRSRRVPVLVIAGLQTELYLKPGLDHSHELMIQETIRQSAGKIGRDVLILGPVADEDVSLLHAAATVCVTATRSEGGLSGTMLEAMRVGTPIIATELEVFTERIPDEDVIYFPVDDAEALGAALVQVCEQPEKALARAAALKAKVDGYTIKDVAKQYMDVFRMVMK